MHGIHIQGGQEAPTYVYLVFARIYGHLEHQLNINSVLKTTKTQKLIHTKTVTKISLK